MTDKRARKGRLAPSCNVCVGSRFLRWTGRTPISPRTRESSDEEIDPSPGIDHLRRQVEAATRVNLI